MNTVSRDDIFQEKLLDAGRNPIIGNPNLTEAGMAMPPPPLPHLPGGRRWGTVHDDAPGLIFCCDDAIKALASAGDGVTPLQGLLINLCFKKSVIGIFPFR